MRGEIKPPLLPPMTAEEMMEFSDRLSKHLAHGRTAAAAGMFREPQVISAGAVSFQRTLAAAQYVVQKAEQNPKASVPMELAMAIMTLRDCLNPKESA